MGDLTRALHQMMGGGGPDELGPPLEPRGAAPAQVGQGKLSTGAAVGSGGGVAGRLTETAYGDRTWFGNRIIASTDGIMFCRIRPLASITFEDANGAIISMAFKEPS